MKERHKMKWTENKPCIYKQNNITIVTSLMGNINRQLSKRM